MSTIELIETQCFGQKPIASCEASRTAILGAMEWFRDPSPDTAGISLSSDVYIVPNAGEANCIDCERTCTARLGIEQPKTSEELLNGPYTPTEKISLLFSAIDITE